MRQYLRRCVAVFCAIGLERTDAFFGKGLAVPAALVFSKKRERGGLDFLCIERCVLHAACCADMGSDILHIVTTGEKAGPTSPKYSVALCVAHDQLVAGRNIQDACFYFLQFGISVVGQYQVLNFQNALGWRVNEHKKLPVFNGLLKVPVP